MRPIPLRDGVELGHAGIGEDSFIWAPRGGEGRDTLHVSGMRLQDLASALTLEGGAGLRMSVAHNSVSFTDDSGNPACFSGAIEHGGETVRFSAIEQIRLG